MSGQAARLGFTLAEVLITLGIIGVVAAMTMPSLIEKHKEKVITSKLKKMYSTLSNAYIMHTFNTQIEFSDILPWSKEGAETAFQIFKPYLSIAKDCGVNGKGCFYAKNYKWGDGSNVSAIYGTDSRYYKVLLSDGSSIAFRGVGDNPSAGYLFVIFYDINGEQGPNRWGRDLFEFALRAKDNKIIALGEGDAEKWFKTRCYGTGVGSGDHCTAWVIFNENMDYLHCKELSWNGPKSCKEVK